MGLLRASWLRASWREGQMTLDITWFMLDNTAPRSTIVSKLPNRYPIGRESE